MSYCCVPYCKSDKKKKLGISFHEFPSDESRRQAWLKAVSRKDFVPNDKSSSSVVCSLHFLDSDYSSGCTKLRRLKQTAVPSVFPEYPSYMQSQLPPKRRKLERQQTQYSPSLPGDNSEKNVVVLKDHDNGSHSSSSSNGPPVVFTDSLPYSCPAKDLQAGTQDAVNQECPAALRIETASQTSEDIVPRNQADVRQINRLRVQLFRKCDAVRRLQRENERLRKTLSGFQKHTLHSALRKCLQKVGTAQFCLEDCLIEQIANSTRQRPVWSADFVRECVILYYLSPKAYRYVRNRGLLKLPSKSTLLRYVGKSNCESGVTPLMKERLQQEVGHLKEEAKLCSIIIDEMAISSKYIYDRKMDCFFGQQTTKGDSVGQENVNNIVLANKVLCFMAVGLSTSYRIPCGFFFTNRLSGKVLHELTKHVVHEVEDCGLKVVRIVTDNHKINVTMMRHLGNGSLKPVVVHPCNPDRQLFLSFDQSHIIKNVRNLLLEGDMTDGSLPITGQYIKQLYELQKNEVVKPVRFLTQKHVEPSNFEKMNVGRAVQLFSDEVIAAVSYLKDYPSYHPKAEPFRDAAATVTFMKAIQKWFSIHNVANRTAHLHLKRPDQMQFFCATDKRLQWLEEEFPQYLETLHSACKSSGKKFLSNETYEALLLTSKSTVMCVKFLLESGFFYVLTRNLSSDPVELLFSALRQMAGGNDCLDARAVTFSLEKVLRTGIMCASQASNVGSSHNALSLQGATCTSVTYVPPVNSILKEQASPSSLVPPEDVVEDVKEVLAGLQVMPLRRPPSTVETASIAYIAGFVVKAVEERRTCSFCPILHEMNPSTQAVMGLISLQDRGGLQFPKPEFVSVLVALKRAVDIALPHVGKSNVLMQLKTLILPHLERCPLFTCPARDDHAATTLSIVVTKFVKPLLANVGATVTDKAAYRKKLMYKPLHRKVLRV